MEKQNNNNKLKIWPILIILLVFGVTISYAYFTAQSDIEDLQDNVLEDQTVNLNGTGITLSGEHLNSEGNHIYPGHKDIVKLKVSALHDNGPVSYNLEWVGTNTLESQVTYKIYKSEKDLTPNITCETIRKEELTTAYTHEECTISGLEELEALNSYQSGVIASSPEETTQTLLYNEEITGAEPAKVVYYYVVIEYENKDESQNGDDGQSYNGHFQLNTEVKTKKVQTSIGMLDVNLDKPDFSKTSCLNGIGDYDDNNCEEVTNGLYAQKTSLGTTYYFRGSVNNNWVKFGKTGSGTSGDDIWWRIIRINEDETVRLIYAGTGEEAPNQENGYFMADEYGINNQRYVFNNFPEPVAPDPEPNSLLDPMNTVMQTEYGIINNIASSEQNAGVGYMFGNPGSNNYKDEHENINDSVAKTEIDNWYVENLKDEGDTMLSGSTGFCGDRSLANGYEYKGYGEEQTDYKAYDRLVVDHQPSYECIQSTDLYTTSDDVGKGNGALTYPVGLITVDEVAYAGASWRNDNYGFWLNVNSPFWTMSPFSFGQAANLFSVDFFGSIINYTAYVELSGLRPVVNVLPNYFDTEGHDGTINNPYVVLQ